MEVSLTGGIGPPPNQASLVGPPPAGVVVGPPPEGVSLTMDRAGVSLAMGGSPSLAMSPAVTPAASLAMTPAQVEMGPPPNEMPDATLDGLKAKKPIEVICPRCGHHDMTAVKYEMGTGSYAVGCAVCVCGVGAFSLMGLLPCFLKDCQDTVHSCRSCKRHLGTKKFIF